MIRISNSTAYGLSSGVCTNRLDYITRFINELEVGTVNVWEVPGYRIEMSPFGGIKDSGLGYKEGVVEAMKSFTNVKTYSLPWTALRIMAGVTARVPDYLARRLHLPERAVHRAPIYKGATSSRGYAGLRAGGGKHRLTLPAQGCVHCGAARKAHRTYHARNRASIFRTCRPEWPGIFDPRDELP